MMASMSRQESVMLKVIYKNDCWYVLNVDMNWLYGPYIDRQSAQSAIDEHRIRPIFPGR